MASPSDEPGANTAQAATAQADVPRASRGRDVFDQYSAPFAPVQAATFYDESGLTDPTALAADHRPFQIMIDGLGTVKLTMPHQITLNDIEGHKPEHCRARNDHNAAHKWFRRYAEANEHYCVELPDELRIPEMMHAYYGPEYGFWKPEPDADPDSVRFTWSWKDMLKHFDDTSRQFSFGANGEHTILA